MSHTVQMTVTREMLVSALAAYASGALPSAMLGILTEALTEAALRLQARDPKGAAWTAHVASEMARDAAALRDDETRVFLNGEEI